MRKLSEWVKDQMATDQTQAEAATMCARMGTMARAVKITGTVDAPLIGLELDDFAINGGPNCKAVQGGCECSHAEQKLIIRLLQDGRRLQQMTLLSTLEPCVHCANLIVLSKLFVKVAWLLPYKTAPGGQILRRGGILCASPGSPFSSAIGDAQ
jgi:deoxycytidylate deaminase